MNLANKLTIFRVILIPIFLLALNLTHIDMTYRRYLAVFIFIIASSTDALDGYIARSRNMITNFGKFMDPLADKLLVCAALIAMVGIGDLSYIVVIIIISREFIITGFRTIAADKNIVLAAGNWGKIKTVTQMVMIVVVLIKINYNLEVLLIFLSVLFTVISGAEYIIKNLSVLKG